MYIIINIFQAVDCIIKSFTFEASQNTAYKVLGYMTNELTSQILLKQNEAYSGGFTIMTLSPTTEADLGNLVVKWKRNEFVNDFNKPFNELKIPLAKAHIENRPFEIEILVKDLVEYGEIITLGVRFSNKSGSSQKIQLALNEFDGYLVAGDIRKNFDIQKNETAEFEFNILPMWVGKKKLPGLQFVSVNMENRVIWDSSGTRFLTVIPRKC